MIVSKDEKERAIFRSRRMYQSDLESNMATAEERGKRASRTEIAKNLLKRNRPIEEIMEYTGLTRKEIEDLVVPVQ